MTTVAWQSVMSVSEESSVSIFRVEWVKPDQVGIAVALQRRFLKKKKEKKCALNIKKIEIDISTGRWDD